MNRYLDTRRLSQFISLFWMENNRGLIFLLLAVGAFLAMWLGIFLASNNTKLFSEISQVAYYFIGLFLSGCLVANFLFSNLHHKAKSISYLLLPASAAEKLFTTLFFGVGIYSIGYTMIFYLVEPFFVISFNELMGTHWTIIDIFNIDRYKNPFFENEPSNLFFLYFGVQAFFITGSLYFDKYSFFKTIIALLFVWIFVAFLQTRVILNILPAGRFIGSVTAYEIIDFKGNRFIEMPAWFTLAYQLFYSCIITLGLWAASYFLLKEKQVS